MKILLLGEYSNLHWTLAEGLRYLGHNVVVASDGDGFKNHQRDIDLFRKSSGVIDTYFTIKRIRKHICDFSGFDVVQLINPCFTTLNTYFNRKFYRSLKKHNKKVFLGAFGDDAYWLKACLDKTTFRYSEFYIGDKLNSIPNNKHLKEIWSEGSNRERLNTEIAESCDGIIACLYEYFAAYKPYYNEKLSYIPLPINLDKIRKTEVGTSDLIRFFVGINRARTQFKGTDRLYKILKEVEQKYPNDVTINTVESLTYQKYIETISASDVVLDQLYSYSPAMNGLLALALGKLLVSGGEPEMYDLLSEQNNKPVINVYPSDEDIYTKLESIVLNKQCMTEISDNGRLFVEKHHNHIKVAQQYLDFWTK